MPVAPKDLANAIRFLSADAIQRAKSGHPGMPLGIADAATALFTRCLNFDAARPQWPNRDRFVLSAGHGSMLQYSLHYLLGIGGLSVEDLKDFRQLGSKTPGHPERGVTEGVETTTGPLGEGLAAAVGMAMAERMAAARHGEALVDHYTYVLAGDGCLMEGLSQEAIALAGHFKLSKLILLFDDNSITIDGATTVAQSDDTLARFKAAGWEAERVDGHDPEAVVQAIERAKKADKPSMIACKTTIGFGAPTKAGSEKSHGAPLGDSEIAGMRESLGWPHAPFEVPEEILSAWREAGRRGAAKRKAWEAARDALSAAERAAWEARDALPAGLDAAVLKHKNKLLSEQPARATRKSSQDTLDLLSPLLPGLIGGSADLTGSNLTQAADMQPITPADFSGRYVYWGVREHGMAAAMLGMAGYGAGFIPYAGTFLVFSDFCRPAIRLAALMQLKVVFVFTHDSIGVGEDGPTHQPVEHTAALRMIPGLAVFRPADAVETLECWEAAVKSDGPSALVLSRQGLPALRHGEHAPTEENLCAKGGYLLSEPEEGRDVTLLSTGSELQLAVEAQARLKAQGVKAAVVSLPCWERFLAQPPRYQREVLGEAPRVAIEAGIGFGWDRFTGADGAFVGLRSFGASAPGGELFKHFGITTEAMVEAALRVLGR